VAFCNLSHQEWVNHREKYSALSEMTSSLLPAWTPEVHLFSSWFTFLLVRHFTAKQIKSPHKIKIFILS
jgi:hypothetical protein